MEEKLTTEQWIRAIKALLFANQDLDESDIDIEYIKQLIQEEIAGGGSGGGSVLVVNANEDSSTDSLVLDKTWAEIQEAVVSHGVVVHRVLFGGVDIYSPVMVGVASNGLYNVSPLDGTNAVFTTVSIDDYPKYHQVISS